MKVTWRCSYCCCRCSDISLPAGGHLPSSFWASQAHSGGPLRCSQSTLVAMLCRALSRYRVSCSWDLRRWWLDGQPAYAMLCYAMLCYAMLCYGQKIICIPCCCEVSGSAGSWGEPG